MIRRLLLSVFVSLTVASYCSAVTPEAAQKLVKEIESRGGEAEACQADMANMSAVQGLFAETLANYGRLDILVNNAAVGEFLPHDAISLEHYNRIFDVNVRGPLFAILEAAKIMLGGLLESGAIRDPNEARFLRQRLEELEARRAAQKKP